MKTIPIVMALLGACLSFNAFAGVRHEWTREQRQALLGAFVPSQSGPFFSSIQGIVGEMAWFSHSNASYSVVEVPSRFLKKGGLEVWLHVEKKERQAVRAPLVVVLNPLFGENSFHQMTRFIEFFAKRGYHVAVFPNTFADVVTERAPTFFPGDVFNESKFYRDAIDQLVAQIGSTKVDEVSLVGLSYGAFLSAVIKADDAMSSRPVIEGPALLINPPYDMLKTSVDLDESIAESKGAGGLGCLPTSWQVSERCSKVVLSRVGFQSRLENTVRKLNASRGLGLSDAEIKAVTFDFYVKKIARVPILPGQAELAYWISLAQNRGYESFLVVGSSDDPVNRSFRFEQSRSGPIDESHWLEVPTGGHTGLRLARGKADACPTGLWFDCFLDSIFPL